jgi:hypothetical protein
LSPLCITPLHLDVVSLQTRVMVDEHRPKRSRVEVMQPTGSPSQLLASDREVEDNPFVCTSGDKVGLTPSSKIQQVLEILVVATMICPSSLTEVGPLPRRPTLGTV